MDASAVSTISYRGLRGGESGFLDRRSLYREGHGPKVVELHKASLPRRDFPLLPPTLLHFDHDVGMKSLRPAAWLALASASLSCSDIRHSGSK